MARNAALRSLQPRSMKALSPLADEAQLVVEPAPIAVEGVELI
jgi:hypothetical protein